MKSCQLFKGIVLMMLWVALSSCATPSTQVQAPPPETTTAAVKNVVIQKITFNEEEKFTRVVVESSETMPLPFYKLLSDPLRIAIDIPNTDVRLVRGPLRINNGTVGDVVTTQFDGKGRVEIGLIQMANYNVSKEDRVLTIDVEKTARVAEVKPPKPEVAPSPAVNPPKEETASSPPSEPMKKAKELVDFVLEDQKEVVTLNIFADGKVGNYNAFKLDSPARLVVDIWDVRSSSPKKVIKSDNPIISKIRVGTYPDKVRLVFDCPKPPVPAYQINRVEDKLVVSLGNVTPSSEPQGVVGGQGKGAITSPKPTRPGVLTRIDFKQIDHKSRVVAAATEEFQFEAERMANNILSVTLKNISVPKTLQRQLDAHEFESAVDTIDLKNVKSGKWNDTKITIKLKEEVPFETTQEGRTLFIDIDSPKQIAAAPQEAAPAVAPKEEAKPAAEAKPAEKELAPGEKKVGEGEKGMAEEGRVERAYSGRKISLDFKDADVKNILRLIAEVSNLNIIAGDDVTGKVSMRLVDVPWDQALDVILQSRNLGMTQMGNVIRVAPRDTLKKEVQTELEAKRAKERLEDLGIELVAVNYGTAKDILPQVKSVLSDRGDIRFDERTNTLIIKDIAAKLVVAKNLVKSLDTKTPQVMIEARIIEADLTFQRELGVQWGFLVQSGKEGQGKWTSTKGGNPTSAAGAAGLNNLVVDLPATPLTTKPPGILEFIFNSVYGLRELDIAISAHENKSHVRVISSPKIAALDNKESHIEQGIRIPVPKVDVNNNVSIEYIDANLNLTVTPHVTNDGNIKMKVKVKKDAPLFNLRVQNIPSIDKKEAETEAMVKDNGVMVIGGIYTIDKSDSMEGVPLLNKVPLLGWLFKTEGKTDERKDLLIFISPKILKDEI